jgi:hypothetical protein
MKNHLPFSQLAVLLFLCFIGRNGQAQFVVTSSTDYTQLIDKFISSGISVSNIKYTGSEFACGYFYNGNSANLGTDSGIVLSTGYVENIDEGCFYNAASDLEYPGNTLLTSFTGGNTYDASVLEFDLVPAYDTITFSFIYGSEDYPEYVGSNAALQDHPGVFISGANPGGGNYTNRNFVLVPHTNLHVIPNNINSTFNSGYFVESTGLVVFDGYTTLLEVNIPVIPYDTYHFIIGIADGGDAIFDSGVFLKSRSLTSHGNTAIADAARADVFHFYPNPATDRIIFNTENNGTLTIANQLGQFVDVIAIANNQTPIAIDQFQSGIYFLTFQAEKYHITKKLIVYR